MGGEWIPVADYADIMGVTKQRVYQRVKEGTLAAISIEDFAQRFPQEYRAFGRGPSQALTMLVWLDDDDVG